MAADNDMLADHQRMWNRFCRLMAFAIAGVVIVLGGLGLTLL
jgi:hypothetical protein